MLSSTPAWLASSSDASWDSSTHLLSVTGPATIIADPGADEPLVSVNGSGAALNVQPANDKVIHLGSLTLSNGGSAEVTRPDPGDFDPTSSLVVVIGTPDEASPVLSIDSADGSTLGLEDNHLLVHQGLASESNYIVGLAVQSAGMNSSESLDPSAYEQDAMPIAGSDAAQQLSVAGQSLPVESGDVLISYDDVGNASEQPASDFQAPGPAVPMGMFGSFAADDSSDDPSSPISGTTPAEVSSVVVNGNIPSLSGPQRSMVDSIQYTFSEPVTLSSSNAFSIAVTSGQTGTVAPPLSLTAAQVTAFSVLLTWTGQQGLTYNVYRADQTNPIATGLTATSYLDQSVSPSSSYSYSVTSIDASGESGATATLSVTTPAAPFATTAPNQPSGLSAYAGPYDTDSEIELTWSAPNGSQNVTEYKILRNLASDPANTLAPQVGATPASVLLFVDTGLDPDTSYRYQVIAIDSDQNQSTPATITAATSADVTPPSAPSGLTATAVTSTSITLSWIPSSDNVSVDHYQIVDGDFNPIGSSTSPTFTATGLTSGDSYTFYVSAVDSAGNTSGPSLEYECTTLDPEMVPDPNGGHQDIYGDSQLGLNPSDLAPNQYIPPVYQDYFYSNIVPAINVLGQRITGQASLGGWVGNLQVGSTVFYDGVVADVAYSNANNSYYVENGISGPDLLNLGPDISSLQGVQGTDLYRDVSGTGEWTSGDPIWEDLHGDGLYHAGDPVIYNPDGVQLTDAVTFGKANGLWSYDVGNGSSLVAFDARTFRDEFANAFTVATLLCSDMADPAAPSQQWSLGGVLNALGTTPESTITGATTNIDAQGYVSFQGAGNPYPNFALDQIGDWASSRGWAGDFNSGQDGYLNPLLSVSSSQPLVTRDWTLIPATPATANTPALAYVPGMPTNQSLVFPEQFQELHDVLEELSTATPWTYVYPGPGATPLPPNPPPPPLPGTALNIAEPPTDPIPLTTAMDYFNVVPDSNLDGIVQVPADFSSLQNGTGSIELDPDSNMATTYLPIITLDDGQLPAHLYLEQGAFGTTLASEGTLSAEPLWTYSDASDSGSSFAFSLDTRVQVNMFVNDGLNHILELEVIRPGGNAVEFNFPWNPATSNFSTIGTPRGWNGRDADRTYVLRDITPWENGSVQQGLDGEYALEFASGIDQIFVTGYTTGGDYCATLSAVTDANGLGYIGSGSYAYGIGDDFSESGPSAGIAGPQYVVAFQWTDGQISGMQYQSTSDPSIVIDTKVNYENGTSDVQSLEKHEIINGVDQGVVPDISYVAIDADEIMYGVNPADALDGSASGITVTRDGSFVPNNNCNVTLTTTVPNVVGYQKEEFSFNSDGLITQDTVVLSEDGTNETTGTTSYSYLQSRSRYDNGAPLWGKVSKIIYPDDSWEEFTYETGNGWLYQDITPYESGIPDAAGQNVVQYAYDQNLSGYGFVTDPNALSAEPTEVAHYVAGVMVSEEFDRWTVGFPGIFSRFDPRFGPGFESRMAATAGATWATGVLASTTVLENYRSTQTTSETGGDDEYISPTDDEQLIAGPPEPK